MRRLVLLLASAHVLIGCGAAKEERMAAFICENIPSSTTLDDLQDKLDNEASLAAFYKEEYPWVYDRETGDLYEYEDFEDALVPIKDLDMSGDGDYIQRWHEYSSKLSKDSKKLRLKIAERSKIILLSERIGYEYIEIYDIEAGAVVSVPGEKDEMTSKCMDVPTAGIDVSGLTRMLDVNWVLLCTGTCGSLGTSVFT